MEASPAGSASAYLERISQLVESLGEAAKAAACAWPSALAKVQRHTQQRFRIKGHGLQARRRRNALEPVRHLGMQCTGQQLWLCDGFASDAICDFNSVQILTPTTQSAPNAAQALSPPLSPSLSRSFVHQ